MKKDTHTYTASIAQSAHLSSYGLIETSRRLYAEAHIKGTLFVFNKIADQESETYLREELAEEGNEASWCFARASRFPPHG